MMTAAHTAFHVAVARRESPTECSCTASRAPGRNKPAKRRSVSLGSARLRIR
jgi:hypothetical protein